MATKPKPADRFWVSNEAFLRTMFGDPDWENVSVVTLPEVPSPFGWPAHRAGGGVLAKFRPEHNNYFGVSLFSRPVTRRKETFLALRVLALDDVGAKVPMDRVLAALGEPTYRIETSPGSEHWGYRLDPPVDDIDRASRLIKRVIVGLCGGRDPGMDGVTRVMRLPVGTNVKKSRLDFTCRLILLDPGRGLDPAAAERALPMPEDQQAAAASTAPSTAPANPLPAVPGGSRTPDPVWLGLDKLGLVRSPRPRQAAGGVGWDITCPWLDEHTPSQAVDSGTFYFQGGGFKCWHGHCVDKHPADVRARVEELLRADSGGLMGLDDLDPGRLDAVDPAQAPASPVSAAPEPEAARTFWSRTVYHAPEDRFIDLRSGTVLNDKALNLIWTRELRDHLPPDAKGKPIPPSVWFRESDRARYVDRRTWWPGRPELFIDKADGVEQRFLNTWRDPDQPLRQVPDQDLDGYVRGSEWWKLGDDLTGLATPEQRDNNRRLRVYQSMIMAAPEVKPGYNPLWIGPQGVGKEHIWAPLLRVLGPTRSVELAQIEVGDRFTSWFRHKLIMLAELRRTTRGTVTDHDQYNALKQILDPGKPFLLMNEKYREPVAVLNCFVMVLTSNEDRPMSLAEDDRRFWVVRVQDTAAAGWTPDRHQRLADWRESASPWGATNDHAIVEWLIRYWDPGLMLGEVRGHAPMTQDKLDLIREGQGPILAWLLDRLSRTAPDPLAVPDLITAEDMVDQCNVAAAQGGQGLPRQTRVPTAESMGRFLARAGCAKLNDGKQVGVARVYLWATPRGRANNNTYQSMGGAELVQARKAHGYVR